MDNGIFSDWQRVIVVHNNEQICGYCTVAVRDCIPSLPYSPYIGYMFVDEKYRGRRLSKEMISFAVEYLKEIGFCEVYLVSDQENLYEKYGFSVIDRALAPWGSMQKVYNLQF